MNVSYKTQISPQILPYLTNVQILTFIPDFMVRTLRAEWGEGDNLHTHEVCQYHYLLWKDFIAPEHPTGVLSFLRRINEAYSNDQGPLLVHCRYVWLVKTPQNECTSWSIFYYCDFSALELR